MTTHRNWILDLLIFAVFVIVCAPLTTSLPLHEWLSLVFVVPLVLHLLWHWNWVRGVFARRIRKLPAPARFSKAWNLLLFVLMVIAIVTGILISEAVLPTLGIYPAQDAFWTLAHRVSTNLTMVMVGVHLALHWRWIVSQI